MTIKELLNWATNELTETADDDASRDAEYLLAHVLKTSREYILAHPDRALRGNDTATYKTLVDRRRTGEPLSTITGEAWFWGLPFSVNKHILTPRPETELLITLAQERFAKERPATIIDVGTGSGCIAIALAKTFAEPPPLYAIDISPEALAVAEHNAERHQCDHVINFLEGNLLEPLPRDIALLTKRKWIIGNLPYLPHHIHKGNLTLRHEPTVALAGGDDGLDVIRGMLAMMEGICPPWTLFLEIDPSIKEALAELLSYHFPAQKPIIVRDLHGHERVCIVTTES